MSPEELGAKLEQIIVDANGVLSDGITSVQDYLYNQLVKVLKGLELDDNGYIIQNANNRKIIQDTINTLDSKIQTSGYKQHLEKYLQTIPKLDQTSITYFEALSSAFKANRQFISNLQKSTVSQIEELLLGSGFESQIKIPLSQVLNQNINSGGSFTGLLDQVKQYIKGDASLDGKLLSYSKQITRDALFNYSRAFQQAISQDLGLEWYCYSGGLIDKSRPFCKEHAGGYFIKSEIESWADEDWQGKRPDTTASSIFIYVGGYNCTHSLIPVDVSTVPLDDLQGAKDRGFAD